MSIALTTLEDVAAASQGKEPGKGLFTSLPCGSRQPPEPRLSHERLLPIPMLVSVVKSVNGGPGVEFVA